MKIMDFTCRNRPCSTYFQKPPPGLRKWLLGLADLSEGVIHSLSALVRVGLSPIFKSTMCVCVYIYIYIYRYTYIHNADSHKKGSQKGFRTSFFGSSKNKCLILIKRGDAMQFGWSPAQGSCSVKKFRQST